MQKTTRWIGCYAAVLLMIATGVVGAATPKSEQKLRQAGGSSVYFYDVASSDTHGTGKLMLDVKQRRFVFNGQDFIPLAEIALRARAEDSSEYVIFATGKVTPSGNLHIAGSWEAGVVPRDVVAGGTYELLNGFHLFNEGIFIAKLAVYYSTDGGLTWTESGHTDGISRYEYAYFSLRDHGIPEGALVREHAIVVGGKDRTGSEIFQCAYYACGLEFSQKYAGYYISGKTWNPTLSYKGTFNIRF